MKVTRKRSLTKTLTWRCIATTDTFILSLLIININSEIFIWGIAAYIAIFEVLTKMIIYYLHERVWNRIQLGRVADAAMPIRSFIKAITWRVSATLDTFLLSFLITGRLDWASSIAIFEILTKSILYYFHERFWNKTKWGRVIS